MKRHSTHPAAQAAALALCALSLSACDNNNGGDAPQFRDAAIIAGRTLSYDAGALSLVDVNVPYTAQNGLAASDSDTVVRSGGDHYFQIKRGLGSVVRFEADNPAQATYSYSTQDPGPGAVDSNPYDLIIVSDTKAYLLRYGAGKLWIVNPSAATEAGFKIGEIDLSQYDIDGVPQMTAGLLKDGKLYVAMQRLDDSSFAAVTQSYVAVIDTTTDTEITTATRPSGLKGIELPVFNVAGLASIPGSNKILAIASGGYTASFEPAYDGGIVSIDSGNYSASMLLDDGDAVTHPVGQLYGDVAVASSNRAYFVGSAGFGPDQTLYRFDPSSAAPTPVAVPGFSSKAIGSFEAKGIAIDPNGKLWLSRADASAPGFTVLGFAGGAETIEKDLISTVLIPVNIAFVTRSQN